MSCNVTQSQYFMHQDIIKTNTIFYSLFYPRVACVSTSGITSFVIDNSTVMYVCKSEIEVDGE